MKLPSPKDAYAIIWQSLTQRMEKSSERAAGMLQRRFSTPSSQRKVCVLLVDELDYMMTKDQKVIYHLFHWPQERHSRLVVIGIANTMDLPERLHKRVISRIGLTRLTFPPYSRQQLELIVADRLKGLSVFDEAAIELCSRKVASWAGDVRKALEICRRATEICEDSTAECSLPQNGHRDPAPQVTMSHIEEAVASLFSSPHIKLIADSSVFTKFFLCALLSYVGESPAVDVLQLHSRLERLSRSKGFVDPPSVYGLQYIIQSLQDTAILAVESNRVQSSWTVSLLIQPDDIRFALRDDDMFSTMCQL